MLELQEIKAFLEDQSNLIIDLNISAKNMNRLFIDKYEFEGKIKEHGFFQHHIYQLKFISVIQLSKLFSPKKNEKRSFHRLCNKLETSEYGASLKELFESNQDKLTEEVKGKSEVVGLVVEVRSLLSSHNELINRVIALRDQVYAHIDKKSKTQYITMDEIEILVELANKVYNLIRLRIFFWQTRFEHIEDWSIDYVLLSMSENKKRDIEKIRLKKGLDL
ncbi:AbiU2 domain-containing protein [Spirosoma pollinicola]|uniref:Uncharacterized protein n=1 Tax=Spirosoma pollinicola TaxID=2057025 RepID=A0A2K8YW81_9BACT|nr:hypothetical protein [Spirosoma pollinicola]AUD01844.1 hypothetical protein CWM47_08455 [Spirosoma pollinicola]